MLVSKLPDPSGTSVFETFFVFLVIENHCLQCGVSKPSGIAFETVDLSLKTFKIKVKHIHYKKFQTIMGLENTQTSLRHISPFLYYSDFG
jgi:hypothetical protein